MVSGAVKPGLNGGCEKCCTVSGDIKQCTRSYKFKFNRGILAIDFQHKAWNGISNSDTKIMDYFSMVLKILLILPPYFSVVVLFSPFHIVLFYITFCREHLLQWIHLRYFKKFILEQMTQKVLMLFDSLIQWVSFE